MAIVEQDREVGLNNWRLPSKVPSGTCHNVALGTGRRRDTKNLYVVQTHHERTSISTKWTLNLNISTPVTNKANKMDGVEMTAKNKYKTHISGVSCRSTTGPDPTACDRIQFVRSNKQTTYRHRAETRRDRHALTSAMQPSLGAWTSSNNLGSVMKVTDRPRNAIFTYACKMPRSQMIDILEGLMNHRERQEIIKLGTRSSRAAREIQSKQWDPRRN